MNFLLYLLAFILGVGVVYGFSRILSKKTALAEKLIAFDILSGLLASLLVIFLIISKNPLLLTLVSSLVVLSFLATLGLARLLSESEDVE